MSSLCGVAILLYTLGPGALVQDLDPDDLPLNLVAAHESDVVAKMLLAVERLDPAVIVAHPVLCIYPHSHTLNVGSVMNMKIENRIPNVDNNPSTPIVDQVTVMITL